MTGNEGIQEAWPLIAVGLFLLAGYVVHVVGQRAHVPRVTLLLLVGVVVGPGVLGLVPESVGAWFPIVSEVALSMVGFMLGEQFLGSKLRELGRLVTELAIFESLGAAAVVFVLLLAIGIPLELTLLLAGVAPASAPAATSDVIRESRASGKLTDTVLGVVAVDDATGIITFSCLLVVAQVISGGGAVPTWDTIGLGVWEVVGGIGLGAVLGVPMAWSTGHARSGSLTLVETLGFVLLCGGLATVAGVSYLLACIALGAVVANRAKHHTRPFHAIEGISQPFLIVFFLMAGFEFDPSGLAAFGLPGVAYVVARILGKLLGAGVGARVAKAPAVVRRYLGWCLLPQAGVALGLGLLAAQRFPEYGGTILSLLVGTTFVFEVIGPLSTRIALRRAGEIGKREESESAPA